MSYVRGSAVGDLATIAPKDQTDPQPFRFVRDGDLCHFFVGEKKCRGLLYKGKWAWVAPDVEKALDLSSGQVARYCLSLEAGEEFESIVLSSRDAQVATLLGVPSTVARITLLYRSGLLNILMMSRKPAGRALRKWLAREVLPQLMDTGTYTVGGTTASSQPAIDYAELAKCIATAIVAAQQSLQPQQQQQQPSQPQPPQPATSSRLNVIRSRYEAPPPRPDREKRTEDSWMPLSAALGQLGIENLPQRTFMRIAQASNTRARELQLEQPAYRSRWGTKANMHQLCVVREVCEGLGVGGARC